MAELVDAPDSKSGEEIRESSTLSLPIVTAAYLINQPRQFVRLLFCMLLIAKC
jgi:hypothetical protein